MKPLAIDLCCGLGGWTDGFLAAGYRVIGFDIVAFPGYRGELVVQDISTVDGSRLRGVDVIVASPPCREFTLHDLPWTRATAPPPDMSLVNACYRIRDEARPRLFLLENVRGAQYLLGRAISHLGPYYFWGDAALLPRVKLRRKEMVWGGKPAERARIPFPLAYGIALAFKTRGP